MLLSSLTKKECVKIYERAMGVSIKDNGVTPAGAVKRVKESFEDVYEGWCGNRRNITGWTGVRTEMLIAADVSWGDPVTEVESFCIFKESGMALAAGFRSHK